MPEVINRSLRQRSLYGLQWYMGPSEQLIDLLRRNPVKPAVIKAISGFDKLPLVRSLCGTDTLIIARDFLPDPVGEDFRQLLRQVGGDPKAAALYDFQQQEYRINSTAKDVIWEASVNEFFPYPNEDTIAAWKAYATYCLEYCRLMDGHGRKAAVFSTTCGTPEPQYFAIFKELVQYVHRNGHYLVPHEYKGLWAWHWWGPNQEKLYRTARPPKIIREPDGLYAGWLVGRFVQMLAAWGYAEIDKDTLAVKRLATDLPNIILGEYGQGPLNTEQTFMNYYGLTARPDAWRMDSTAAAWRTIDGKEPVDGYLQDLTWLDNFAHEAGLKGICFFVSLPQAHPQWKWYDIGGECMDRLFSHLQGYRCDSPLPAEVPSNEEPGMADATGIYVMPLAPSGIPIYQTAATSSPIAGYVYPGDILMSLEGERDSLSKLGQEGTLLNVTFEKGPISGWVGAWLVRRVFVNTSQPPSTPPPGGTVTPPGATIPPQESGIPVYAVTYATSGLNIRKGPGLAFDRVGKATMGMKLLVLGSRAEAIARFCKAGEWIPVRLPNGVDGWGMALWLHRLSNSSSLRIKAPVGHALIGLHGPTDPAKWAWTPLAYDVITRARIKAVKLLAAEDMDGEVPQKLANLGVKFVMARVMAKFHTALSPEAVFKDAVPNVSRLYEGGVRYFELLNEPNLNGENSPEGMWVSWQNGTEFAEFFIQLLTKMREKFPEAKFGWPGLSPGPFLASETGRPVRYDAEAFMSEADFAARACDFVCMHAYWGTNGISDAVASVRKMCDRYKDRMIVVSEFSNTSTLVSKDTKAAQYLRFYQKGLEMPSNLGPLMAYTLSSSYGYASETWAGSVIPEIVGGRTFS